MLEERIPVFDSKVRKPTDSLHEGLVYEGPIDTHYQNLHDQTCLHHQDGAEC